MCNFLYSCKKEPCYQNFHKNPTWLPVKLCNRHVIKNLVIKFFKEITFFLWIFTPNKLQMFFVHLWHAKVMSIIFNINSYQNKIFMLEDVIKWNLPLPNSNLLSLFLVIRWFLGWYKLRIPLKTFGRFFCITLRKISEIHLEPSQISVMKLFPKTVCYLESVRILSFSGPYFSAFGLNTDQKISEYGHFSRSIVNDFSYMFDKYLKYAFK